MFIICLVAYIRRIGFIASCVCVILFLPSCCLSASGRLDALNNDISTVLTSDVKSEISSAYYFSNSEMVTQFADLLQLDNWFNAYAASFHSPIYRTAPNEPMVCLIRLVEMNEVRFRLGGDAFEPVHISTIAAPISLRSEYVDEYTAKQVSIILSGESSNASERARKYGIFYGWDPNINIAVYAHELGHLTPICDAGVKLLYEAHRVCSRARWRTTGQQPIEDNIIYFITKIRRYFGADPISGAFTGLFISSIVSTPQLAEEARASFRGYMALSETCEGVECAVISQDRLSVARLDFFTLWLTYFTPVVRGIEVGLGASVY